MTRQHRNVLEPLAQRGEVGAANAAKRFRHMAQSVRLLASLQLPSETLRQIQRPAEQRRQFFLELHERLRPLRTRLRLRECPLGLGELLL